MLDSLTNSVIKTLRSSTASRIKPFQFGGCRIEPSLYRKLALFMDNFDNPNVVKGKSAHYRPDRNELAFNFDKAITVENKALVIHEATHAAMDMLKIKMNIKYAEMFAYVAQCQFAMIANPQGTRLWSGESYLDSVFEKAWRIANLLQIGGSIDSEEYEGLADAILQAPKYSSDCGVVADYNGIW